MLSILQELWAAKKQHAIIKQKSVMLESAYFNPKSIIGKSIKYNINSEAAHKFEKGVDPLMQEKRLEDLYFWLNNIQKFKILKFIDIFQKISKMLNWNLMSSR